MTRRPGRVVVFASAAAVVVLAAAALYPITVLDLENPARACRFQFRVGAGDAFAVIYHHSIYDQPVTERFVVDDAGRIVLTGLSSPSAAVREYFGIVAAGDHHAMNRVMPQVVFRIAAGVPQRLQLNGTEYSFLDFGDHGDRLVMRAARKTVGGYLLTAPVTVAGDLCST